MKSFKDYSTPESLTEEVVPETTQDVLSVDIDKSLLVKKDNINMLESFSKNYASFVENIAKAEALMEQIKTLDDLVKREELENVFTAHLLMVSENINNIKTDVNGINERDIEYLQGIVEQVEAKADEVSQYLDLELPKIKKTIFESQHTSNLKVETLQSSVDQIKQSVDEEITTFRGEVATIEEVKQKFNDLQTNVEGFEQLVELRVSEINQKVTIAEEVSQKVDELDSKVTRTQDQLVEEAFAKQQLNEQLSNLYTSLSTVNTELTALSEQYQTNLNPAVQDAFVRINAFEQNMKTVDQIVGTYNDNLDKAKAELRQVVNEVNQIFINDKYVELNEKVDQIQAMFNSLQEKEVLVEEMAATASREEILKLLKDKSFQQPNPPKVDPNFTAVTAKLKFLEQAIGRIAATGPGSGEVNLRWLDDVDRNSIQDGYYLAYNGTTKKFEFRQVSGGPGGVDQVQSNWTQTNTSAVDYIKNKPTLATVATTGSYNDLLNQPTIPAAQVNSDWNATTGVAQILNKPTIPAAQIQSDWTQTNASAVDYIKNKPTIPDIGPIQDLFAATGEPMGHEDRTQSTMSFVNSTRTFTISPVSGHFDVWVKGTKYTYTTSQSVNIPNATGLYYIYFNSSGIGYQTSFFIWDQQAMTAYVYYNAVTGTGQVFDERHGITLDWQTHEYLHRTHGALYSSGFAVSNYSLNGDGSLDAHCQLDLAGGTFFDEDNQIDIVHSNTPVANTFQQDLQGPARIPMYYWQGTDGGWVLDAATNYPMKMGTNRPQYNYHNGTTWTTNDIDNNKFGVTFIIATNILNTPVIGIIGQSQHSNVGDAEAYNLSDMDLSSFPVVEMRVLYRVVYECKTSYTNTPSARITSIWDLRITASPTTNVTTGDHGSLTGLLDNDHPQYLLVANAATVATSGSYNDLLDLPTGGSTFSGSYNDLTDKPTLATVATSGSYYDLIDHPILASVALSGSYNDLSDTPSFSQPTELVNGPYSVGLDTSGILHLPYDVTLQTYSSGNLEIAPSGNKSALYLSKDSGASSLKSVEDLEFTSGSFTDPKLWTFNTDGNIVLPVGGTITNSGGTSTVIFDTDLASVATSGSYNDLIDTPTIPAAQVNSDWNSSSGVSQILNKPDLTIATLTSGTISATPSSANDIPNKAYVDAVAGGVNYHPAVDHATTAALGSYTYYNGPANDGIGATITGPVNGTLTIDGHTISSTDITTGTRFLIKDEPTAGNLAVANGVYLVTAVSTVSTGWVLTRALDYDKQGNGVNEIDAGDFMYVISGTVNASTAWVQQAKNVVIGTTNITFIQFSAAGTMYSAGTGLSLSLNNQFSITSTGVTANTYGSSSSVPVIVVNDRGQITSASNTTIAITTSNVSGLAAVATSGSYNDLSGIPTPINLASPGSIGATTPATGKFTTLTATGQIISTSAAGDEGGEFILAKPVTNTSIATSVTMDIWQNRIRFFETGGTNRGAYIDISTLPDGISTNLTAASTGSGPTTGQVIATSMGYNLF